MTLSTDKLEKNVHIILIGNVVIMLNQGRVCAELHVKC